MNYRYQAFREDEAIASQGMTVEERKTIKKPVTITITVEMEEDKYLAKCKKYKEPIPEKIFKIFK